MTKQEIIRKLCFYRSVLSTIWKTKDFTETDYYLKFTEIEKKKVEEEISYYEGLHEILIAESDNEEAKSALLAFCRFCKDIGEQLEAGTTDSLKFAHWLKTKITFTSQQRKELGELIKKIEDHLTNLDQSESSTGLSSETEYEVIYKPQTAYEKDREVLQKILNELENKLGLLFEQKWTSHDFEEKEIEEYLLIEPPIKKETTSDSLEGKRAAEKQPIQQQAQILQQGIHNIPGSWPGKNT